MVCSFVFCVSFFLFILGGMEGGGRGQGNNTFLILHLALPLHTWIIEWQAGVILEPVPPESRRSHGSATTELGVCVLFVGALPCSSGVPSMMTGRVSARPSSCSSSATRGNWLRRTTIMADYLLLEEEPILGIGPGAVC